MNIIGFQAHFWCIHAQFLSLNLISEILAALKEHLEGLHLIVCLTSPLPLGLCQEGRPEAAAGLDPVRDGPVPGALAARHRPPASHLIVFQNNHPK